MEQQNDSQPQHGTEQSWRDGAVGQQLVDLLEQNLGGEDTSTAD
ncbi:hypothetical protein [Ferrimonas senticii]|nr:hypothetical protein [Ferrimonas senticii]